MLDGALLRVVGHRIGHSRAQLGCAHLLTDPRKEEVAPRARFELATLRLTAECSTIELPGNGAGRLFKSTTLRGFAPSFCCHSKYCRENEITLRQAVDLVRPRRHFGLAQESGSPDDGLALRLSRLPYSQRLARERNLET